MDRRLGGQGARDQGAVHVRGDVDGLHGMITTLYSAHASFRVIICQWLNSGHFSSQYYIGATHLVWTANGCLPDYDAPLVYGSLEDPSLSSMEEGAGVEETKTAKRKREDEDIL